MRRKATRRKAKYLCSLPPLFRMGEAIALIAIFSTPLAAEIYVKEDQAGNKIFTDSPSENAKKLELEELPVLNFPAVNADTAPTEKSQTKSSGYEKLVISSPRNDEAIRQNEGKINVQFLLQPKLKQKHQLKLYLDGQEAAASAQGNQFNLTNIDRGTHTIQIKIIDPKKRVIQSSNTVKVHLHRFSKLHKKN